MTNEEMDQLDRWLAIEEMKWDRKHYNPESPFKDWQPTRNIAQAWEVLDKIMQPPQTIARAKQAPNTKFMLWFESANLWAMTAEEAALAISINAKKALEDK